MTDSTTLPIKRKRGAPYGNRNAFRHGFYSKTYFPKEEASLEEGIKGQFEDEIALSRVNAARLAELLMNYKDMPVDEVVAVANALNKFVSSIQSLSRTYQYLYRRSGTPIEQAMAELAALPIDLD